MRSSASTRERLEAVRSLDGRGITVTRRCELLGVSRTGSYYEPRAPKEPTPEEAEWREARMRVIYETHMELPASGARKMARECGRRGLPTTRHQAGRLMAEMGIRCVYPKPSTSKPDKDARKFPYLLRGMRIDRPNQVWAVDITYVPMGRGHMYLTAIIDWATRKLVGHELSPTLEAAPVVACFRRAVAEHGKPEIANSDQGSQFTSDEYTSMLEELGVRQSMDGKARWVDNVMVERWFRTLKTECLSIDDYSTPRELRRAIDSFVAKYNTVRLHESLDYRTPDECYYGLLDAAA